MNERSDLPPPIDLDGLPVPEHRPGFWDDVEQGWRGTDALARRWIITRLLPGIALVVALLWLVPALVEWKATNDATNAEPAGSATFRDITVPPYPRGVLELTGQFGRIDHAARRAWFAMPFDFIDPIPTEIAVGEPVQVTCRVRWVSGGVGAFGAGEVRVDLCRDIVRLGADSG